MLDEKMIEELKAKYADKELELIEAAGEKLVAGTPSKAEWNKFQSWIQDEKKKSLAYHDFVIGSIVYPPTQELEALLDRKPGLAITVASQLSEMAGLDSRVTRKKL
jgi:hypothetical protein